MLALFSSLGRWLKRSVVRAPDYRELKNKLAEQKIHGVDMSPYANRDGRIEARGLYSEATRSCSAQNYSRSFFLRELSSLRILPNASERERNQGASGRCSREERQYMKIAIACSVPWIIAIVLITHSFSATTPTWFQPGDNMVVVDKGNGVKQITPNTASIATRTIDVANVDHWCKDISGTTAYVCGTPAPVAWRNGGSAGYQTGWWVMLQPSASSLGPASLNVNAQGVANIKLSDGTTDPGTLLQAGRIYLLVQDGVVWRMTQGDSRQ